LLIGEFTKDVNRALARAGERHSLNPREVGGILTTFGFVNRKRARAGWTVWLGRAAEERIHFLMSTYGIRCAGEVLSSPMVVLSCPFCLALGVDEEETLEQGIDEQALTQNIDELDIEV
jgi:hypothetical protein